MDGKKVKFSPDEALKLVGTVRRVIATKGLKVVRLDSIAPAQELLAALIGPSGNLRAPAVVVGGTLVVGFNPEVYAELLGAT